MSGEESPPKLVAWLTGILGLLGTVVTVLTAFLKIAPIEIDTGTGLVAFGLFGTCLVCAGVAVWHHRHGKDGPRRTALFATVAVVALLGGTLLAIGSARGKPDSPTAAGTPTIGTRPPTTTTSTTPQSGGPESKTESRPTTRTGGGGQDGPPNTAHPTATAANPTHEPDGPAPANDAVRYQGEFRLNAAQDSVDLDINPPEAYGPTNDLWADDHAIWPVVPDSKGVVASGSPTRAQCADAIGRANPPPDYFDNPQPGDVYCVRTSDGRYALVRVVAAATKDFTLALTVWS